MQNVYESIPVFQAGRYCFREIRSGDLEDLLAVYSDKKALPFFNSDNCHGDNFYYPTAERMAQAMAFWREAYANGWFVRWAVLNGRKVIGTAELFLRRAGDAFDNAAVLRLDLGSDYETGETITSLLNVIVPQAESLFGGDQLITKGPIYAVERIEALRACGFRQAQNCLVGEDGYAYNGYWYKRYAQV